MGALAHFFQRAKQEICDLKAAWERHHGKLLWPKVESAFMPILCLSLLIVGIDAPCRAQFVCILWPCLFISYAAGCVLLS
jgi:hypothetical protein